MKITLEIDTKNQDDILDVIEFCTKLRGDKTTVNIPTDPDHTGDADIILPSADEVRAELKKLAKTNGTGAAKAIVTEFGVEKFTDIKESDYGRVMDRIHEVMGNVAC